MRISLIVHLTISWLLFTTPVSAQLDVNAISESIVRVRAYDRNKPIAEGSGFVINAEGYVLTNAHLLADARRLTVISLKTGAEIVAKQTFARRDMNLALLHVQGLGLPALNLSEQGAAVDRDVLTLKFGAADSIHIAQGKIATHRDVTGTRTGDPVIHLLTHTAIVTSRAFGMPLFNECGDVVAINLPDPARGRWPFRKNAEPEGAVFALRSGDIITALKDRAIAHQIVEEACLSASERAAADSIKAIAERIQKARARADSVKMAVADSIKAAADSIKAEADKVKAEASRIKAEADRVKAEKARTDAGKSARKSTGRFDKTGRGRPHQRGKKAGGIRTGRTVGSRTGKSTRRFSKLGGTAENIATVEMDCHRWCRPGGDRTSELAGFLAAQKGPTAKHRVPFARSGTRGQSRTTNRGGCPANRAFQLHPGRSGQRGQAICVAYICAGIGRSGWRDPRAKRRQSRFCDRSRIRFPRTRQIDLYWRYLH